MFSRSSAFIVVNLLAILLSLSVAPASAQQVGYAKDGVFVGVSGAFGVTIQGEKFTGDYLFRDDTEFLIVPRLHRTEGLRYLVGFRSGGGAFEISFEQTPNNGSFLGLTGESLYRSVNLDGKFFVLTRHRLQPYVVAGLAIPWLTVEDGSATRTITDDAIYHGVGFNTGGGVAVFPHPRVGIAIGYAYRWLSFSSGTGAAGKAKDIDESFYGRTGNFIVTSTVTF